MGIKIQMRDIQILKFVFACRVVTYNQIAKRFFKGKHPTLVKRHIRRHREAGYLKAQSIRIDNKIVSYVAITERGFSVIKDSWPFEIDNPLYKSDHPLHDIYLNDVILRFESLKCFKAHYTENLLQCSSAIKDDEKLHDLSRLYADGALFLVDPQGTLHLYAVEFEQSKKSQDRYREKLMAYSRARHIDGILYIVTDQEIANAITKIDQEVCNGNPSIVYLSKFENVLNSQDKIYFINMNSPGITIY